MECPTNAADRGVDILGFDLVETKQSCFINSLRIFNLDQLRKLAQSLKLEKAGSPLKFMSHLGVSGVLKFFLNNGAGINIKCGFRGSVLSAASYNDHKEMVRVLLEKGAEVNAFRRKIRQRAISSIV